MITTYRLIGFSKYIIENKILYRKAYKTKSKSCKWQYRNKRKLKKIDNNGTIGYLLIKNKAKKRKFYSLDFLHKKLK